MLYGIELGTFIYRLFVPVHPNQAEGLQHPSVIQIHHGKERIGNAQSPMSQSLPQIPFCLAIFIPLYVAHGMAVFQLPGATGLSLQQFDGRGIPVNILTEFFYGRYYTFWKRPICVEGYIINILDSVLSCYQFHRLSYIFPVRRAAAERGYFRPRILFAYGLGGSYEKVCI